MNIYLISNDDALEEKKINSLSVIDNDLIILFNHAYPIKFSKILNHNNKWLFLNSNKIEYWGYKEAINNFKSYKKIIFNNFNIIESHTQIKNIILQYFNNYDDINNYKLLVDNYPNNRYPTIGFIAFNYILKKYIIYDKLYLVNFTGHPNNHHPSIYQYHDYTFEQNFYKNNNITII